VPVTAPISIHKMQDPISIDHTGHLANFIQHHISSDAISADFHTFASSGPLPKVNLAKLASLQLKQIPVTLVQSVHLIAAN
jgi:hypothetical protein